MSSSPEGQSYSSTPPPHHQGKLSVTSESTTISGFTAVNGRGSPPQTYTKVNGVNSVTRVHSSPNMENPVPVQPYDHDTIRVDSGPPRASPQEDPNSGKRKRSIGEGDARNPPREQEEYVPQDQRRSPPPPHNWTTSPAQGTARLPNQQTPYQGPDAEPRETPSWYPARQQRAESPNSDSRLAAALQHETQNLDDRHMRPSETPVMDHIGGTSQHQATATPDPHDLDVHGVQTTAAGVQVDPKKRKRVFSNRTKTGCQTCRKRKKKCDENKPHCNNCVRGGFVCEGYANKTTWPKAPLGSQKPTPVAIQAREDYSDTGGLMPRPIRSEYHQHAMPQTHTPQSHHDNGRPGAPIVVDEDHPRNSWGTPNSWSDTPSRPYAPEQSSGPTSDFQHGLPLRDFQRPQQSYEDRTQSHPMAVTSHGQTLSQYVNADVESLPHVLGRRNEELTPLFSNRTHTPQSSVTLAQRALQHTQPPPPPPTLSAPPKPKSEKDKMLAGDYYYPHTHPLIDEREACKAATWRFNNAQGHGASREERNRLFRSILIPDNNDIRRPANPMHPVGQLGKDVLVEAPFHCEYGYNISIGDNVEIKANCTIIDTSRVTIGNGCIIGPNVSIYAGTVSVDPARRSGNQPSQKGKNVYIGENVFIGGNVVIKPGVQIGKGSTIGAGAVVHKDVPNFVIFKAPDSEIRTGVWQDNIQR